MGVFKNQLIEKEEPLTLVETATDSRIENFNELSLNETAEFLEAFIKDELTLSLLDLEKVS